MAAEDGARGLTGARPAPHAPACWVTGMYLSLHKRLLTAMYRLLVWLSPESARFPRSKDALQAERHRKEAERLLDEGQLAYNCNLVMTCLDHYNSTHKDCEYEPAPGKVTRYTGFDNGRCWTHGNFVARRKRYGLLKFLPTPRTLFFFEFGFTEYSSRGTVETCTPLDEPVTEAYTFLGFPLGWGTRRSGSVDQICQRCHRRFVGKACVCGHYKLEFLCDICHPRSHVLHPLPTPGEFGFESRRYSKLSL